MSRHHDWPDEFAARVDAKLDLLLTRLEEMLIMDAATQTSIDALNAAVTQSTTVETSVETLLKGLSTLIAGLKAGKTDPAVLAAIDAATAIVNTTASKAAAAVTANTP